MNVFCVRSLHYSFNSHSNTEGYVFNDCIYVVALPMEVMFCGLLRVSQASNMELVFGVFIVGPGLDLLSQASSYVSVYVPTVHCI